MGAKKTDSDVDSEMERVEDMVDESRGHHQPRVATSERGENEKGLRPELLSVPFLFLTPFHCYYYY